MASGVRGGSGPRLCSSLVTLPELPPALRARTVAIRDPGDLLGYLAEASDVAWVRRGDGFVGLGVALRAEVPSLDAGADWWADVSGRIDHSSDLPDTWGAGPLAFGSFAFDPGHTSTSSVLVVPRLIVGRRGGRSWLTLVGDGEPTLPPVAPDAAGPGAVAVRPGPLDAAGWAAAVARVVAAINDPASGLGKVVLARAVDVVAEHPIEARWLARRLAASYPSTWTFSIDGLVGASPEMLLRAEGGLVTSRVLAGTIRRGDPSQDEALAETLAGSGKDLEEHEFAVASVADALRPYCTGMNVPDAPFVLQLPNVMHLASDVTGVMRETVSSLRLAGRLHPSAAVCGTPTASALAAIAAHERLDRGRYAGPVGWIDTAGGGEWAIALRCGRLAPADPRSIRLYAGCGIVGRSRPDAEVAETVAKLRPMLDALGVAEADRSV
nr:isochorismate synthase [Propionibacterium sp.]